MESTRGNTHSVTFFPPGNVFFGSMISTMHPLTTNTAAVLREAGRQAQVTNLCYVPDVAQVFNLSLLRDRLKTCTTNTG